MLDTARRELREKVAAGARPQDIDAEIRQAAPWLDEEQRAALWLYAWHCAANGDGEGPPRRVVRPSDLASR